MTETRRKQSRIRRLTPAEVEAYDHISPAVAERVRIARIPALPGRYVGLTLGPLVLLQTEEPTDGTSALLAHELVHVRQWSEQGPVRFAAQYVRSFGAELVKHRKWNPAYRAIPAEVEAREVATRWAQRRFRTAERD